MRADTRRALASRLSDFDRVVEIGVGNVPDLAAELAARDVNVTATDIRECSVPDGVRFVVDDVTDPDRTIYHDVDAIYGLNLPPELQRPGADLAASVDAVFLFTTLGADPPIVAVSRETIPGDTIFVADPQRA